MLRVLNVEKTFNKGTINEKRALNGLNLELQDGDFCHCHRRKRSGKIHHAQCHRRSISH